GALPVLRQRCQWRGGDGVIGHGAEHSHSGPGPSLSEGCHSWRVEPAEERSARGEPTGRTRGHRRRVGIGRVATWATPPVIAALGAPPTGERAARIARSPQYRDGRFRNPVPPSPKPPVSPRDAMWEWRRSNVRRTPEAPIPIVTEQVPGEPASGVRITWYGHASALVEIEGHRILV